MKPTYEELEQQVLELLVQLANAESKCRELAEFKSRVYAQMGAGCDAPEFAITEGLNNLHRFADTLHFIEREFFTKEVSDEECEGETVEECPLCWGMTVEQYVSEFGKCLAEVRAQGVEGFLKFCGEENSVFVETKAYYRSLSDAVDEFSAQLRQGVQS